MDFFKLTTKQTQTRPDWYGCTNGVTVPLYYQLIYWYLHCTPNQLETGLAQNIVLYSTSPAHWPSDLHPTSHVWAAGTSRRFLHPSLRHPPPPPPDGCGICDADAGDAINPWGHSSDICFYSQPPLAARTRRRATHGALSSCQTNKQNTTQQRLTHDFSLLMPLLPPAQLRTAAGWRQ